MELQGASPPPSPAPDRASGEPCAVELGTEGMRAGGVRRRHRTGSMAPSTCSRRCRRRPVTTSSTSPTAAAVEDWADKVVAEYGTANLIVNNAGVAPRRDGRGDGATRTSSG